MNLGRQQIKPRSKNTNNCKTTPRITPLDYELTN